MIGHPWHPALVHFPLACWVLATTVDIAAQFFAIPSIPGIGWGSLSHVLLWAGVILAVPAMIAGFVDYIGLPAVVQDCPELSWHIASMATAWALFLAAGVWRVRTATFDSAASLGVTLLELTGSACLIAGGYFASIVVFDRLAAAKDRSPAGQEK